MKQIALTFSLALLAACAADETPPGATARPVQPLSAGAGSAPATGGRNVQVQNQTPTQATAILGDKSQRAPVDLTRTLTFFDGEHERTVWISNELVAEVAPSEEGRASVLAFDTAAEVQAQPQAGLRLWRVRAPQGVDETSRALTRDALHFSPVVHESDSSTSPRCALPGGAVATFPAGWDRARIDTWLAAQGTRVVEPVVIEANMYLVASDPGLASIELANRLHQSGEIVACTPNFWREVSTR